MNAYQSCRTQTYNNTQVVERTRLPIFMIWSMNSEVYKYKRSRLYLNLVKAFFCTIFTRYYFGDFNFPSVLLPNLS